MRWTLWLSAIAVPFSYGTSILLARVGPEVIGTYGLLMVYIGAISSVFYFGGDAVVIKFVPELEPGQRLSYLVSYCVIVLAFALLCLGAVALWPRSLHYLFGDRGGTRFQFEMLCLSPVYIMFSLVVAAHKALLEMRWAHVLMRLLTIGSFLFYAALYAACRGVLISHYTGLIWGIYLGLTAVSAIFGLTHLVSLDEWPAHWSKLNFFLPSGFWNYLLTTEQVSLVSFLMLRLDLILIMDFGGIATLGKYVAILSVAEAVRASNRFFVDTLLPSLTNVLATGDRMAASQIVHTNLRTIFLVNLLGMGSLSILIGPILRLFGPQYCTLRPLFLLMIIFFGLAAPGTIGGTLLSSVGKQYQAFWVCLGQVTSFVLMFTFAWPRWELAGAIIANGLSSQISAVILLSLSRAGARLNFGILRDYGVFAVVVWGAAAFTLFDASATEALVAWTGAMIAFLFLGRYSWLECRGLISCFWPSRFSRILA